MFVAYPRGGKMRLWIAALLACSISCVVPVVPVTKPAPPASHHELMSISVPGAVGTLTLDPGFVGGPYTATVDTAGLLEFTITQSGPLGETLTVTAPGYIASTTRLTMCVVDCNQPNVILVAAPPPLPPVPTRDQVINVRLTFQGLMVTTKQLGTITWFEPWIMALTDPADRQAVYAAKHAQGDTHLILQCYSSQRAVYNEAPWQNIIAPNCDADLQTFLHLVEEVVQNGFYPIVVYDGDNGDDPAYGYPNAARQAPVLANLLASSHLGDLNRYTLYGRLWDDVFYGSTPPNIRAFGDLFRSILPNGFLAIEFNTGHIPTGGGPADYAPGGTMTGYDVIMGEFDWPTAHHAATIGGAEWQILSRMLGPRYVDDPNQTPSNDGPWYLAIPTPRGPYAFSCFEWGEYQWTHNQMTPAEYMQGYAWYKARGCPNM